jgi:hypothetical protein
LTNSNAIKRNKIGLLEIIPKEEEIGHLLTKIIISCLVLLMIMVVLDDIIIAGLNENIHKKPIRNE